MKRGFAEKREAKAIVEADERLVGLFFVTSYKFFGLGFTFASLREFLSSFWAVLSPCGFLAPVLPRRSHPDTIAR